ncbi:MAG TPA: ferritin-like domain-containing protein [Acidimicrobiales bacterium]
MPILTPTAATGARSRAMESTYVDPARQVTPRELEELLAGTGLNGPFVADLLSDVLAHERAGAQLYRSVANRSHNPVLKKQYEHFGKETLEHVEIVERLIERLGGDPGYVSPSARATTKAGTGLLESTFLLAGSVDLMTQELVMLDAVLLAEAKDHANWSCLSQLVESLPEGEVRDAVAEAVQQVEPQEDEHLGWATEMRCTLVSAQAKSKAVQVGGETMEQLVARVQSWLD